MKIALAIIIFFITTIVVVPVAASRGDCEQAKAEMAEWTDPARIECRPASARAQWGFGWSIGGWYDAGSDTIVVITDYHYLLYKAIIAHEHGHWYDWHYDPTSNSWESVRRGVDVEQYAKVYAWLSQGRYTYPQSQPPSPIPSDQQIAAWQADGFMPIFTDPPTRRLYLATFLREPDRSGIDFWTARRAQGQTLFSIADHFAVSNEFIQRYGHLTNRQFVKRIYFNVLGRAPDQGGLDWWTNQLNQGRSRDWLIVGFSESAEFKQRTR